MDLSRRELQFGLLGLGGLAASGCASLPAGQAALPRVKDIPPVRPERVDMSTEGLKSIATMMQGHIDAGRISGGVTAVARRGKLVHFQGHGYSDWEAKTPMPTDSLFVMMSSTKPVTGVAILQQMEEGKVALDDPIDKFIPELKDFKVRVGVGGGSGRSGRGGGGQPAQAPAEPVQTVPANRQITIRDLVTHTSGLNSGGRGRTLAQGIPTLAGATLQFQPGARWAYSATTGPDVLARVVEITSKTPYDVYLRERIFEPCGMKDTAHNLTQEQHDRLLRRYRYRDGAWSAPAKRATPSRTGFFAGSAGLQSTAADYLQFEQMLLNGGTIHGKRVLKREGVDLMRTNLVGDLYRGLRGRDNGQGFGVLVRVIEDEATCGCARSKGAFGWAGAYGTTSWTDPEEELVAVLMIQQSVDAVQDDFEKAVRAAIV